MRTGAAMGTALLLLVGCSSPVRPSPVSVTLDTPVGPAPAIAATSPRAAPAARSAGPATFESAPRGLVTPEVSITVTPPGG